MRWRYVPLKAPAAVHFWSHHKSLSIVTVNINVHINILEESIRLNHHELPWDLFLQKLPWIMSYLHYSWQSDRSASQLQGLIITLIYNIKLVFQTNVLHQGAVCWKNVLHWGFWISFYFISNISRGHFQWYIYLNSQEQKTIFLDSIVEL